MKRALMILAAAWAGGAHAQAPTPVTWISPGIELFTPYVPRDTWVADLDGDGDDDLLTVTGALGGAVVADLQAWRGAVQARVILAEIDRVTHVAALDIDLDGDMDVVVGTERAGTQLLRRSGPGLGDWVQSQLIAATPAGDNRFVVTDLNGDGRPDLAIEDRARRVVFAGAGEPVIGQIAAAEYGPQTRFADVDGDGDVDGVVEGDAGLILLRNDGGLPWTPVELPVAGAIAGVVDIGPAGGLALIGYGADGLLRIAPNRFALGGTFGPWADFAVEGPQDVDAIDLDGDGDQDLVGVAAAPGATALALENQGGAWTQRLRTLGEANRLNLAAWSTLSARAGEAAADLYAFYDIFSVAVAYVVGRGVVGATATAPAAADVEGGAILPPLRVEVEQIAPYDGALRVTGLELLLLVDDDEAAALDAVFAHVDVYVEASGDDTLGDGDVRLARLEAFETVNEVDLDHPALAIGANAPPRLYVQAQLTPRAHLFGATARVGWLAARAAWDDGAVPVVNQRAISTRWALNNRRPVANFDAIDVLENSAQRLDLLANDVEPQGDPMRVVIVTPPRHGEIEIGPDGEATYVHDGTDGFQIDEFTYRAVDPGGARSRAVGVIVTILPVNDAPVAQPDAYVADEDTPLAVEPDFGVLFNDTDEELDALSAVLVDAPQHGQLALQPDGGFVYVPEPNFTGDDQFTYRPDDGQLGDPVTVAITVLPANDVPGPAADQFETARDASIRLQLAAVDPEGDAPLLLIEAFPNRGHLIDLDAATATVTYVPPRGFVGEVRFDYRLGDAQQIGPINQAIIRVGL